MNSITPSYALLPLLALLPGAASAGLFEDDPRFSDDDLFTYLEAEVDYAPEDEGALGWEIDGWYGGDYEKLWFSTEGERSDATTEEANVELLYGRYLSTFWDWQVGLRHDFQPDSLNYAVLGVQGLAPYRFETSTHLYLSEEGDVSAEAEVEYTLLLTQRLIAEPFLDLELNAQDVPELGQGSGLTELGAGIRLRYEVEREFAPYLELSHERLLGDTADLAKAAGAETEETVVRVGLRVWY